MGNPPAAPDPFTVAYYCLSFLAPDEKIALMKAISASLGGPRFYTGDEVTEIVRGALEEYVRRQQDARDLAALVRRMN